MTHPTTTQLRRALADVEARIIEMIAERERLLSELRWRGQMEVDRLALYVPGI